MVSLKTYIRKKRRNKSGAAEEDTIRCEILKTLAASRSFAEAPLPSAECSLYGSKGSEVQTHGDKQKGAVIGASVEHSTVSRVLSSNLPDTVSGHVNEAAGRAVQEKGNSAARGVSCGKDMQRSEAVLAGQHNSDECARSVHAAKAQASDGTGAADKHAFCKETAGGRAEGLETAAHDEGRSDEECLDQETRKKRLRSFAETPAISILAHRFGEVPLLSPQLLKISRLFTVILSICKFNSAKDMMTIYHKSKKCIENLLNKKVSIADIEQINWLVPDALSFRKIEIMHLGEKVRSFTIEVVKSSPRLVEEKIMQFVRDTQMERKRGEDVVVPRRALFSEGFSEKYGFSEDTASARDDGASDEAKQFRHKEAEERGRSKALTVLERIREKERMRRESFIAKSRENEEMDILRKRIESYFAVENKKSEKVEKLVRVLCIHNGKEYMKKLCEHHRCFVLRECEGEAFLVLDT